MCVKTIMMIMINVYREIAYHVSSIQNLNYILCFFNGGPSKLKSFESMLEVDAEVD
jgi:hypothetical protein